MKKISIVSFIVCSICLISCNSFKGEFRNSEEITTDTLNYYLDQYVKSVEAYEASAPIIIDKDNYEFVDDEFSFVESKINKSKSFLDEHENRLTDEMRTIKSATDNIFKITDEKIKEALKKQND